MTLIIMILLAVVHTVASIATYDQAFRATRAYFILMLTVAFLSAVLWAFAVQRQSNNSEVALLSFAWDFVIVLVYSVIPMLMYSKQTGWQFWLAMSLSVFGIMWMKMLMED
jgi:hypothetical protein